MRRVVTRSGIAVASCAALALACSSGGPSQRDAETYLRWVSFEVPVNEDVLLRWPKRKMPLRVYLPPPPEGLFEDGPAVHATVRRAVLDWTDAAGDGLPSFTFVDAAGDADIPITWAAEPTGDWYIAFCSYDIDALQRRFGVDMILVTGRWRGGRIADIADVHRMVLHEMGHALGLGGHSPDRNDAMYPSRSQQTGRGLSARDRATLAALYARPIGKRIVGAKGQR